MILIKKILIFCVFAFIFCLRPALVESADIDEINIMLKKEKDKLSKLENEIENQTKIRSVFVSSSFCEMCCLVLFIRQNQWELNFPKTNKQQLKTTNN